MRYRFAVGRTRVNRRRTSWASVIFLLQHPYCRWINAIDPVSANAVTSIMTIGEADHDVVRKIACQLRQILNAQNAEM